MPWYENKETGPVAREPKEIPKGLWNKCPDCGEVIYTKQLNKEFYLCSKCGYHFRIDIGNYIELLLDEDSFVEYDSNIVSTDPLKFFDSKPYPQRISEAQKKTGRSEGVTVGIGKINGIEVSCGFMDFNFIGGSMGSVVGERITRAIERGTEKKIPVIMVCASGGARMQESIISLMQMAKTSAAVARHDDAKLPYINILTHPTMAGVMASFASIGDITIAEPGSLLGFAGRRVIEQTIGKGLPEGFQSAEFFMEHGFVDKIVPRHEMRDIISNLLSVIYSK